MILHKSSLRAVDLVKEDKGIPMLNNVHVDKDGITSVIGNKVMLVISAVKEKTTDAIAKMHEWTVEKFDLTIPADSVKEVLKNIPKDAQFKGLLEHAELSDDGTFRLSDGRRQRTIKCTPWKRDYPNWRDIYESKKGKSIFKAVYNRKRLLLLLQTMDKCCEDTSGYSPIWFETLSDGSLVIRSVNMKTAQKALGIVSAYDGKEGEWLDDAEFELKKVKKKLPKRRG